MNTLLPAQLFDGASARPRAVQLRLQGAELLVLLQPDGDVLRWPLSQVRWPERTRHGQRVVQLEGGGELHCPDRAAFDAWRQAGGARESLTVRAQQSWRAVALAVALLVGVLAAGYLWGLPLAARGVLAFVPPEAERALGEQALDSIRGRWLSASKLPASRQQQLAQRFARLVQASHAPGQQPGYTLHFADASPAIGASAFALPGGPIVVTDQLVELLEGHDDTILGVLAHELGHVTLRHGMRSLVQVTLLTAVTGVALGDFSALLAAAPAALGQMAYSRGFEREADAESARILRAGDISPAVMVVLFERLAPKRQGSRVALPIALASHPLDDERVRFFRDAAAPR